MKTIYKSIFLIPAAILSAAGSALSAPAGYDGLARELAASASGAGLNRFAVAPFKTAGDLPPGAAAQAQRRLSEALKRLPGTGVMDAEVLKGLGQREGYWAQVLLLGTVHASAGGPTLVAKAVDRRGRTRATLQAPLPADSYPAGLRDAPASPAQAACARRLATLDNENAAAVDLKARYWAAMARTPGFSYKGLARPPGSELRDYATMQEFYRLLNAYYAGEAPVYLSEEELSSVKWLLKKEEKDLADCAGK